MSSVLLYIVGEAMNLIAAPKAGKSWLAAGLALAVATGGKWLDKFRCTQGRVLIVDAELHPESLAFRMPAVGTGLREEKVSGKAPVKTGRE